MAVFVPARDRVGVVPADVRSMRGLLVLAPISDQDSNHRSTRGRCQSRLSGQEPGTHPPWHMTEDVPSTQKNPPRAAARKAKRPRPAYGNSSRTTWRNDRTSRLSGRGSALSATGQISALKLRDGRTHSGKATPCRAGRAERCRRGPPRPSGRLLARTYERAPTSRRKLSSRTAVGAPRRGRTGERRSPSSHLRPMLRSGFRCGRRGDPVRRTRQGTGGSV